MKQPVAALQEMLAALARRYPQLPAVIPDGIFGEQTLEGVMTFQRDFALPVTGIADRATWDAMARETARLRGAPRSPFPHYLDAPSPADFASPDTFRGVSRYLFRALARRLGNFRSGDGPELEENIRTLRRLGGLAPEGGLDEAAWRKLLRLYQLFVLR